MSTLGPKVVGEEESKRQIEYAASGRAFLGPKILDHVPSTVAPAQPAPVPLPEPDSDADLTMTAADAINLLETEPMRWPAVLRVETKRQGGPRITVMRALVVAMQDPSQVADAETLALVEGLIAEHDAG